MPNPKSPELPPQIALLQLTTGVWITQALYVAAALGVADLMKDGPKSCDDLGRASKSDPASLKRILRLLASFGVFAETSHGTFGLTPMAECLRTDSPQSMRAWATMMGSDWHWKIWGDLLYGAQTGKPAFDHVHGIRPFEWFSQRPEVAGLFNHAMASISSSEIGAILAAYDFSKAKKIVDVAGGNGSLLRPLLQQNKQAGGVLFDMPHVVDTAKEAIEKEGLIGRIDIVGGSFFQTVPTGGDLYLLKHILHDFNDKEALAILQNIKRAMSPGAKLLTIEMIIPPGNEPSFGKMVDLEMMLIGGVERTESEYRNLLTQAGFKTTAIVPTASPVSLIEGTVS
ncbi:MAG TPA: methyltransferase [bacterium]|nr:methyltransferase [bacterium]